MAHGTRPSLLGSLLLSAGVLAFSGCAADSDSQEHPLGIARGAPQPERNAPHLAIGAEERRFQLPQT